LLDNLASAVSALPPDQLDDLLRQLAELERNRLALYQPYPPQRRFHEAGAAFRERLLRAGNQNGKTFCGGCEAAYHLTGQYPNWWAGRRWDRPILAWATGHTGESTRDAPQKVLMGTVGEWGTGTIPADTLVDYALARGVADLLDYVKVRHVSGGLSTLRFKFYEQGRRKWQGPSVDLVWFDEEPPSDIYDEGLARTIATGGSVFMTFTPLEGMSDVVHRFLSVSSPDRHDTNMTIEDAEHIPPEERARIIASFPAHEREARAKGIPVLGSGRIFPVPEEDIAIEDIKPKAWWPKIGAMDFGWDHPFAAVELIWNRDDDIVYVTKAYRAREQTPVVHAGALRTWGAYPWAWPHDGLQHSKDSGEPLANQYGAQGLNMLPTRAQYEDGSAGVEAGLMDMLTRMQTGRLKVLRHLADWWEEFRLYHRKDGQVFKERDDLMSATRYGLMMLRYAEVEGPQAPLPDRANVGYAHLKWRRHGR
jgi:phage terminase large subunit-like protein